ncbi:hemolysin family protein [Desulfocurvus vexinensis]|uniref:hemolysin family protein n=1 Tax=Desulfocurvus vexinensis TaxID=399548 RepID=UPI00049186F7|nr:hemolysin family protein [Desulfocurvus vexinensis]
MLDLILAVGLAVGVSFFCSVAEAVLLSVPWSRIEQLRKAGRPAGNILYALRSDVDRPIAAVLTLNTVAHTVGAAVAGAAAARVFGPEHMALFATAFTVVVLVFSEILPKTMGILYAGPLAAVLAKPLQILVWVFSPVIFLLGFLSRMLQRKAAGPRHTEEDIAALVSLTRRSGVLKAYEERSIKNILSLDRKVVHEIMTPRTVVFSVPAQTTVSQARAQGNLWPYSRVPVFADGDPENIVGVVYRREVLQAQAEDRDGLRMADLMKPARFVQESLTLDRLLVKFLDSRMHLFIVLDEYGGVGGVVSLEDVLEEILGKEIVDETDEVVDTRALARQRSEHLADGPDGRDGN